MAAGGAILQEVTNVPIAPKAPVTQQFLGKTFTLDELVPKKPERVFGHCAFAKNVRVDIIKAENLQNAVYEEPKPKMRRNGKSLIAPAPKKRDKKFEAKTQDSLAKNLSSEALIPLGDSAMIQGLQSEFLQARLQKKAVIY